MSLEAAIAGVAAATGFFTWSHQQRQTILNERFNGVKKRLDEVERTIVEFPLIYASKADLNYGLNEIKDRLNHINDKLDQLIMSKIGEKY